MALIDIPAYALGDQDLWTPKLVKEALVDAFITMERTAGRVGPRAAKAAWPTVYDPADIWEQRRTGTNSIGRGARPQITSVQIQRAEAVVLGSKDMEPWLAGMLKDSPHRDKLELWVFHEVGKVLGYRQKSLADRCEALRWAPRSFFRHVDSAAGQIAIALTRAGVAIW